MGITPSAKAHSQVNPLPTPSTPESENRAVFWIKTILGTPIPYLTMLYTITLLTSMSGMELFGWSASLLTLIYIIADRFSGIRSGHREFRAFALGADISLALFLVIVFLGLKLNAPSADVVEEMGSLRWIVLLYLLTYNFSLFPGLNRFFYGIIFVGTVIAGYAIFQHFTGIDLRYEWGLRAVSAVTPAPVSGSEVYQGVGLFSHHLTYGYSFAMVFCFPLAALMLSRSRSTIFRFAMALATLVIGLSLVWTYGRGVWIAMATAVLFMSAYVSRKALFGFLILGAIVVGTMYSSNHDFRSRLDTIWSSDNRSNNDRQDLWKANVQMLTDYPWIGIGWHQNETRIQEFYSKIGIKNEFGGHAHNNYLQILATTGILGFGCFMLFILGFLLMNHRLWSDVPRTHYWHKVIVLGALGAQLTMHTGGLTQWNFGDAEVNHLFVFVLAVVAYMTERYNTGIVPDDHSL